MIEFKPIISKRKQNAIMNDWCSGFYLHRIAEFNDISEDEVEEVLVSKIGLNRGVVRRRKLKAQD